MPYLVGAFPKELLAEEHEVVIERLGAKLCARPGGEAIAELKWDIVQRIGVSPG